MIELVFYFYCAGALIALGYFYGEGIGYFEDEPRIEDYFNLAVITLGWPLWLIDWIGEKMRDRK